jgi:alpha-tubulin suppressor-like RCC1 family protein
VLANLDGAAVQVRSPPKPASTTLRRCLHLLVLFGFFSVASLGFQARGGTIVAWGQQSFDNTLISLTVPENLTNVVQVVGGHYSHLALRSDGTLVSWGDNRYGQTNVPAGLVDVVQITGGWVHKAALRADGTVVAWGDEGSGRTNTPSDLVRVVSVSAGVEHNLALRDDGTVVAWGGDAYRQATVPHGLNNVVAVAAGGFHSLALRADGTVVAWGQDADQTTVPAAATNVTAIAASWSHNLALRADGTVVIWPETYPNPGSLTNVTAIAAGWGHSLALKADSTVVAWGANYAGQTNVPPGLTNVTTIACGDGYSFAVIGDGPPFLNPLQANRAFARDTGPVIFHARAVGGAPISYQWYQNGIRLPDATNGTLVLSGGVPMHAGAYSATATNPKGETSTTSASLSMVPILLQVHPEDRVAFLGRAIEFSAEARGQEPISYQWEFNADAIPGGTNSTLTVAASHWEQQGEYRVVATNTFGAITSMTASLRVSEVAGWGRNSSRQAEPPAGLGYVISVAGGTLHSLALRTDGTVVAWGNDFYGQSTTPDDLQGVIAIAAGGSHNLALRSDGTVLAWGDNRFNSRYAGQSVVPAGLTDVVGIAAGWGHSLALRQDGSVVAWGAYSTGTLNIPIQVPPGLNNVAGIAGGPNHALALHADGTVTSFGRLSSRFMEPPPDLSNAVAVACGFSHNLALLANGSVRAWGLNNHGQTNVPPGLANVVQVACAGHTSVALRADGTIVAWGGDENALTNLPAGLGSVRFVAGNYFHVQALVGSAAPRMIGRMSDRFVAENAGNVFLHAPIVGSSPLHCQWIHDGTNIPGATNATLQLAGGLREQAGLYAVRASNEFGSITTPAARVSLRPAAFQAQPQDQRPFPGTVAILQAKVTASGSASYQWLHDGVPVLGATNTSFLLTNLSASHDGFYSLLVETPGGTIESRQSKIEVTSVAAWGTELHPTFGPQPASLPYGMGRVVAVAVGNDHALALRADGTVTAWGSINGSSVMLPEGLVDVVAIACGAYHCLALRANGTVVAWGENQLGQTEVPAGLEEVIAISGGLHHSLALRADGSLRAWGTHYDGTNYVPMVAPSNATNAIAIASSRDAGFALRGDGTVVSWGPIFDGTSYVSAAAPAGLSNVISIAASAFRVLAATREGRVVSWGRNDDGQFAVPEHLTDVVAVASGQTLDMALHRDGRISSWGSGTAAPFGLTNVVSITAGEFRSYAIINPELLHTPWSLVAIPGASQQLNVQIQSSRGRLFVLESSSSLLSNSWETVHRLAGDGQYHQITLPTLLQEQRFFRARRLP